VGPPGKHRAPEPRDPDPAVLPGNDRCAGRAGDRRSQCVAVMKFSVVIPVYKNEASILRLLEALSNMSRQLDGEMEAVFVVDGSPDQSFGLLRAALDQLEFPAQLLAHSRNFGSFPAIRTGLAAARGDYFGVMAA